MEMNITHPQLVAALAKSGEIIRQELTASDCHLWHMSSALCGEAGELFDGIKKAVIYRKPLDRENVKEEIGDALFYLQGICQELGFTLEDCLAANIAKLSKRYADLTYSDKSAQERKDKIAALEQEKIRWPRICDLPSAEQEPFTRWLHGQTCPMNSNDPEPAYYTWDYERWKEGRPIID